MPNNETTTKFKVDISELKAGIQEANRQIRLANSEFKAASSGMDDWRKSTEGISAKIKQLESVLDSENAKLANLKKQLALVEKEQGANSKGADELRIAIANQEAAVNKTEKSLGSFKSELEKVQKAEERAAKTGKEVPEVLEEMEKEAKDTSDGFTVLKGAMASLVADGIKNVASSILGLADDTREYRNEMSKLETAFASHNAGVDGAKKTYEEFYAVLGDEGQATEAVNFLAKLTDNEQELATWTDICTGVYGEFGASLPIEGLTEAANETAKVGQVTGPLADALNWAGESEDEFNEKLAACSSEQERQQLIMNTLNSLYSDSAATFRETNAEVIEANKAQSQLNDATASLGETVEPLLTSFKELGATLLSTVQPALSWLLSNLPTVGAVVATITAAIVANKVATLAATAASKGMTLAQYAMAAAQQALNIAMNANPIGLIVLAIGALVTAFVTLWNNCEGFRNFFIGMWEGIKNVVGAVVGWIKENWQSLVLFLVNPIAGIFKYFYDNFEGFRELVDNVVNAVKGFFTNLWSSITSGLQAAWTWVTTLLSTVGTWIYNNVIAPVAQFFTNLWNGIVSAYHMVIDPWIEIFKRLATIVNEEIVQPIINFFKGLWESVSGFFTQLWEDIKAVWKTVSGWFDENIIQPVVKTFKSLWENVSNGAKNAWQAIKKVWNIVSGWFNDKIIKPVTNFFTNMWDGLKNGAKNAWQGIKDTFSKVADFFGDIFSKAWKKVKEVFSVGGKIFDGIKEGIVTAFTTVVNAIIRGINKVVSLPFEGLNAILDKLYDLEIVGVKPFKWLTWRAPVPQIPELARGGVLKRGQVGLLEGDGAEAVVPLENNAGWIRKTAADLKRQLQNEGALNGGSGVVTNNYNFTQNNTSPKALSRLEIYRQTKNQLAFAKGV